MSQDWSTNVVDWSGVTAQATMNNIELMLATLRSNFSGSSAPANLVAGNLFYNTDTGHEGLRARNAASDAWLAVLLGDASQKLWVYRNDACEGWDIDATVTDRVLAVKGGSNAYNANGGTTAGTWTQPNHTHAAGAHTHSVQVWVEEYWKSQGAAGSNRFADGAVMPAAVEDGPWKTIGTITAWDQSTKSTYTSPGGGGEYGMEYVDTYIGNGVDGDTGAGSGNTGDGAPAATWRPAAAIGTLQYPDLS